MTMATLQQVAPTNSHHQAHQQDTKIPTLLQDAMIDLHLKITIKVAPITRTIKTGIGLAGPDSIHAVIDTGVTIAMTHEGVVLSHIANPHATGHHITEVPAHTTIDEIPHTADLHHVEVFPEITVDPDPTHHTNTTTKHQQDCPTALTKQPGNQGQKT